MSFINKMNIGNVSYDIQAGEKVQLTFPEGAKNGTLTDEQLATLQANYQSCIEMVNDKELYYLNDNGHVDGYLTYSHVGIENSKATIKTLMITVSAKSFVIVTTVVNTDAGGKLYRHYIMLENPPEEPDYTGWYGAFYMILYSSAKVTPYTLQELFNLIKEEYIAGAWFGSGGQGSATIWWGLTASGSQQFILDYFQNGSHSSEDKYLPNKITDTVTEL